MKINKFDVACDLAFDEDGILTGWFETPAEPHVRYTIEIDAREVAKNFTPPEFEEVELEDTAENKAQEQVLLPDGTVADVKPLATSDPEGDQQNRTDADAESHSEKGPDGGKTTPDPEQKSSGKSGRRGKR